MRITMLVTGHKRLLTTIIIRHTPKQRGNIRLLRERVCHLCKGLVRPAGLVSFGNGSSTSLPFQSF
ncbi:hypothetical protein ACSBR1_008021 [Camellia fascicularis]